MFQDIPSEDFVAEVPKSRTFYFDFDAKEDGDGSSEKPYNSLDNYQEKIKSDLSKREQKEKDDKNSKEG